MFALVFALVFSLAVTWALVKGPPWVQKGPLVKAQRAVPLPGFQVRRLTLSCYFLGCGLELDHSPKGLESVERSQ